jgi:parvulin-like peptidyl-prolyl isomerase
MHLFTNKKWKGINNILLAFLILLASSTRASALDQVVAVVNDEIITQKDLNDFLNFMSVQLRTQYSEKETSERIDDMKEDLINRLIEDRLILQEAKKMNVQVDPHRIRAKMDDIRKHYPSDREFREALNTQGLTPADVEKKISEQLAMMMLVERKIRSAIVVNPSEVTEFYQNNHEKLTLPEQRVFTALVTDDERTCQKVYVLLKDGIPLEEAAQKMSQEANKLTLSKNGELRPEVEEILFSLSIGEVTKPLKSNNRFYIFRLDTISPSRLPSLSEAHNKIYDYLFEKKMQEKLSNWLADLKKKAFIKIRGE